ncbi:hypothetical protein [Hyalangium rubrum]|uniref:Lipoprotein n=1 Tax=Hyalangium rubrum TaxID=3103134 RepID=A0ABU5H0Q4_9BACT|nr:hypothetical protein [Hyalangium sp. s54d21]MDY7226687.1 hypothetical protein [Hyalangium sp. s54d21]
MLRSAPRTTLPWLALALLTASCDSPKPTGECTGTHFGQRVSWPIALNSVQSDALEADGSEHTLVDLNYKPEGVQGLQNFGVDIRLMGKPQFEASGARTVKLLAREGMLVPEETSLVRAWDGNMGATSGYLTPPGVPVEASVTLNRMTPDHAEGQFTYRYSDGATLTCTFDVPDRVYDVDGDIGGGGGGFDDDDDD